MLNIQDLSKEVDMAAVRGGVTQSATNLNGTFFGGVAMTNAVGGASLIGGINTVQYSPSNVTNQAAVNTSSISTMDTSYQTAVAALGSLAFA